MAHLILGHYQFHAGEAIQNHPHSRAEDRRTGPHLCAPASHHPTLWDFTAHCGVPLEMRNGSKSRQRAAPPLPRRKRRCTLTQGCTVTSGKRNEGPLTTSARNLCTFPEAVPRPFRLLSLAVCLFLNTFQTKHCLVCLQNKCVGLHHALGGHLILLGGFKCS